MMNKLHDELYEITMEINLKQQQIAFCELMYHISQDNDDSWMSYKEKAIKEKLEHELDKLYAHQEQIYRELLVYYL